MKKTNLFTTLAILLISVLQFRSEVIALNIVKEKQALNNEKSIILVSQDTVKSVNEVFLVDLISPMILIDKSDTRPTFQWSVKKSEPGQSFSIKVVEIFKNQIPKTAIKNNSPLFAQSGIMETTIEYPSKLPPIEPNKFYIWSVTVLDANRKQSGQSMIGGFALKMPPPPACTFALNPICAINVCPGSNILMSISANSSPYSLELLSDVGIQLLNWQVSNSVNSTVSFPAPSTPGQYTYNLIAIKPSDFCCDMIPVVINVLPPNTPLTAVVSASPPGDGTKGCAKKFKVVDQCPNNLSHVPGGCGATYQYIIMRNTSAPANPSPGSISSLSPYEISTCNPTINFNQWYTFPNDGNNLNNPNATIPDNLPANGLTLLEKYYVYCYITTPSSCCISSGFARGSPFLIYTPQTPTQPVNAFVCSPPISPQTDYPQCCDKKFILKNGSCTGSNFAMTGAVYHWIIRRSLTTPSLPVCLAEVTSNYTSGTPCPDPLMGVGGWFNFGTTNTGSINAPKLPAAPSGFSYYVSCYIQVPCDNTLLKSSAFATPQKFKVLPQPPVPIITATNSSSVSLGASPVIVSSVQTPYVKLTASGAPSSTVYYWYDNSSTPIQTGPTYTIYTNTTAIHNVYVTYTTSPLPGCKITSPTFIVNVKYCDPCNFSISNVRVTCKQSSGNTGDKNYIIKFDCTNLSGSTGILTLDNSQINPNDLLTFSPHTLSPGLNTNLIAYFKDAASFQVSINDFSTFKLAPMNECDHPFYVNLQNVLCPH